MEKFCTEIIFGLGPGCQVWTGQLSLVIYGSPPCSGWGHIWFRKPSPRGDHHWISVIRVQLSSHVLAEV